MCIVKIDDMPVECFEFLINRIRRVNVINLTVDLKPLLSTTAIRLSSLRNPANIAASQTCPSWISPSPRIVNTRYDSFKILAEKRHTAGHGDPWPKRTAAHINAGMVSYPDGPEASGQPVEDP